MIRVQLYQVIAAERNAWWYCWGEDQGVFSLDFVKGIFEANPDENDFLFNINCPGGEVEEGFAIYDFLRTSSKNIYMNIEGGCHSMAVTLLLAAPLENRTANPNCVALIHQVQGDAYGSTTEVEARAKEMRMIQNQMLDIYAERTGTDRKVLENLMMEQRQHNAKELLQYGFISRINAYNTNFNNSKLQFMKNVTDLKKSISNILNKFSSSLKNYEFVDDNGDVLFTTESEDETLEVGMTASPDGTFTIADGKIVTIEGGVITEITDPETQTETETEEETTNNEQDEEIEALRSENAELREAVRNLSDALKDVRREIGSNYVPKKRVGAQPAGNNEKKGANKEAIRDAYNRNKNKK